MVLLATSNENERNETDQGERPALHCLLDEGPDHLELKHKRGDRKHHNSRTPLTATIQIARRRNCSSLGSTTATGDDEEDEEQETVDLLSCTALVDSLEHQRVEWQDLVQSYHFRDFEGLEEFMQPLRAKILQRHAPTLRLVQEKFREIVQAIVNSKQQFQSILGAENNSTGDWSNEVGLFATPNVRLKRGTYATFLHSDAVFFQDSSKSRTTAPKAMVNIWMSLLDSSISNFPLCFYKSSRKTTTFAENKLYYCQGEEPLDDSQVLEMVYDPNLQWGSFLCFAAGQPESADPVLLHGAVNFLERSCPDESGPIPLGQPTGNGRHSKSHHQKGREDPRKSLEMRFVV